MSRYCVSFFSEICTETHSCSQSITCFIYAVVTCHSHSWCLDLEITSVNVAIIIPYTEMYYLLSYSGRWLGYLIWVQRTHVFCFCSPAGLRWNSKYHSLWQQEELKNIFSLLLFCSTGIGKNGAKTAIRHKYQSCIHYAICNWSSCCVSIELS
jgi:hypothetical protein